MVLHGKIQWILMVHFEQFYIYLKSIKYVITIIMVYYLNLYYIVDSGSLYSSQKEYMIIALFPTQSSYKNRFAEIAELVVYACDLVNSYGDISNGVLVPVFPRYKSSISEIEERIAEYAKSVNTLAFTGVFEYIYL